MGFHHFYRDLVSDVFFGFSYLGPVSLWTGIICFHWFGLGIHKYRNLIIAVYSVFSSCYHCLGWIRVLKVHIWKFIGFDGFACFAVLDDFCCVFAFSNDSNAPLLLLPLIPSPLPLCEEESGMLQIRINQSSITSNFYCRERLTFIDYVMLFIKTGLRT